MKRHAVIIGGGYGGLALANLLGRAGWRVDVFEKNEALGGRLTAYKQDGFTFDIGPSWYLMPEVFEQYYGLFQASATDRLELIRFTPGYKVYFDDNEPLVINGDLKKDTSVFESIEPGAGQVLQRYIKRSTEIYETATTHFLYNNFDNLFGMLQPRTLRYLPGLLSLSLMPLNTYVSKYFNDQRLKQILEYHMVFLGNSPFQAPAVYSLMSNLDFHTGVYYPARGMMSLVDDMVGLGKTYDIHYHLNAEIAEIAVKNGVASGVLLQNGETIQSDVVISNADLHFTETSLLPEKYQTYPETYWKKRQPGPGALVISLGIRGTLPQLQHHTLYFTSDWKENFTAIYTDKKVPKHLSLYICNPNKTDASLAPKDHENLFILAPLPAEVRLTKSEVAALTQRIIDQVGTIIGAPDLASRIVTERRFGPEDFDSRYHAWAYNAFGGESHLLTQSVGLRTANTSRKVKNLYYVGAGTQPGIGLPMCLISAELAYKRIMKITKPGPLSSQDIDTQEPNPAAN